MKVKKVKKRDRIVEIKPQRLNRQIRDQKPQEFRDQKRTMSVRETQEGVIPRVKKVEIYIRHIRGSTGSYKGNTYILTEQSKVVMLI